MAQDNKAAQLTFQQEEEERKKKALQPMVNGRAAHKNNQAPSNSFRKYRNVVRSADGSAVAMKQQKEHSKEEEDKTALEATASSANDDGDVKEDSTNTGNANSLEYKSRILGAGASANTDPSEMTAADDDGEGWVMCTSDIRTMKATGSLHLSSCNHSNSKKSAAQRKNAGPPISQRALNIKSTQGNKYEGDLLLAKDQLMYGAWNQKVRKGKSKTAGQSILCSDLASDLGCHADLTKRDDIKVGFGRRNPNATKFGREKRGKKKKGVADKACGLKRY